MREGRDVTLLIVRDGSVPDSAQHRTNSVGPEP
jgi:hypothetical protein